MFACTTLGFQDHVFVLDAPMQNLRGHDANGKDDLPLKDCDPEKLPSGKLLYKCVTHFNGDYQKLLDEITRLQQELVSCQQGH
ncbi:MAG: hypothetical protein NVS3B3_06650 [Aquirhabdus sp.]